MLYTQANKNNKRLHGLDTLRAIAIIIVLIFHYKVVVSHQNNVGFISELGWTGVDLFFVLSGYLIGNQVLAAIARKEDFSLKLFYIRRLLRTLPNYYFVLTLYFIFPLALDGTVTAPFWQFLTFTQNFAFHPGETFTHSWSLCIEEQFYLIFPLLALLIASTRKSILLSWLLIIVGILTGMILRGFMWLDHGQAGISMSDYYEHIYYSRFTRFDELLPGIAIALFKNFHPDAFAKTAKKGNLLLVGGVVSVAGMFYLFSNYLEIDNYGYSFLMSTFGYSLLAVSFGVLTLSALCTNSLLYKISIPGAANLALWSYAIYLIHKPLFKLLGSPLTEWDININSLLGISIIMSLSILAGWLLYLLIETPFMILRAKLYPVNIATPKAETARVATNSL